MQTFAVISNDLLPTVDEGTPPYIAFLASDDILQLVLGKKSIRLNCTIINDGAFTWTWVGPDEAKLKAYNENAVTANLTRTSILELLNPLLMDVGLYTCIAHSVLTDGRFIKASTSVLLRYSGM